MKERAIVYGLGKCWDDNWQTLMEEYEIVCCVDRNTDKKLNTKGFVFGEPQQMKDYEYDKFIICVYGVEIGIREEIVTLWDIVPEKIYYYAELYEDRGVRTDGSSYEQCELTIVIPTYNRRKRLARTLDILEKQTCKNFRVIILDNDSDYDMSEMFENREKAFCSRIEVRRNISNIGMQGNLAMLFLQVNDGWMWTLADDDVPSVYAVETIMREIEKDKNAGVFWFSIRDMTKYMDAERRHFDSLSELTGFYGDIQNREKISFEGDFIFLSNKVYNMGYVKIYTQKVFTYLYTGVPHIMPILHMLSEKKAGLVVSNKKIVVYAKPDGDHWSWMQTALGMSTIADIPLLFTDNSVRKVLYRLIMLNPNELLKAVMEDAAYETILVLEKLYDRIYKYYLDNEETGRYLEAISEIKKKVKY